MNKKIKKVELVLRKINYLFDSIDANPLQSSNLEMALLKRYAIDLYDTILEFEEADAWEIRNTHRLLEDINTSPELGATVNNEIEAMTEEKAKEETKEEETSQEIEEDIEKLQMQLEETVTEDLSSVMKGINTPAIQEEEVEEESEVEEAPAAEIEEEEEKEIEEEIVAEEEVEEEVEEEQPLAAVIEEEVPVLDTPEFILEKEEVVIEEPEPIVEEEVIDPFDIPGIKSVSNPIEDVNKTTVLTGLAAGLLGKEVIDNKSTISIDELATNESPIYEPEPEVVETPSIEPEPQIIDEVIADQPNLFEDVQETVTTPITNIFSKPEPTPEPEPEIEVEPTPDPIETVMSFTKEEDSRPTKVIDRLRFAHKEESSNKKFNINYNQRFGFINELFDGKEDVYEKTIHDLEGCNNVIEAFTYLNLNVKLKYNWQDDNPLAKDFQQIIKNRFLGD